MSLIDAVRQRYGWQSPSAPGTAQRLAAVEQQLAQLLAEQPDAEQQQWAATVAAAETMVADLDAADAIDLEAYRRSGQRAAHWETYGLSSEMAAAVDEVDAHRQAERDSIVAEVVELVLARLRERDSRP
jgi:hypothetical protein